MPKNDAMKTGFIHLLIDFAIVIGNIFLSHGLFFLFYQTVEIVGKFLSSFDYYQQLLLIIFCAVQIAINIVLYKTLLKRFFKPADNKKPALYYVLPVIGSALGIGSFQLFFYKLWDVLDLLPENDSYLDYLKCYLPLTLLALILLAVIYRLFFHKYVGEGYCVYLLSIFGVSIAPVTFIYLVAGTGV